MSLRWIKLHTTLVDNTTYRRFSPEAKLTFVTALMLAGKEGHGGRLQTGTGPIDVSEIAFATSLTKKRQSTALDELLTARFITLDLTGTYVIERFEEKTADSSTARTRRHRERSAVQERLSGTFPERSPSAFPERSSERREEEGEVEVEYASLRSAAIGTVPGTLLPRQVSALKTLALLFIARFANCKNREKAERFLTAYVDVLKIMGTRGATVEQAWSAVEECWSVDKNPLFGGKIKRALGYLDRWKDAGRAGPPGGDIADSLRHMGL